MTEQDREAKPRRRKRWFWLLLLPVVFVLADALHAAYIAAAVDAWAGEAELTEDGVIAGCEAYDLVATDGEVSDTALLLVHGFNASPRHYDFVAPSLAERGFDSRVMRLPGFAEPFALHQEHDHRDWTAAVTAELETLRLRYDRVGVVGHTLGGAVTIGTLLEDAGAADFAVLLAPAVAVSDTRAPLLSTRSWHEVSEHLFLFTNVLQTPFPMNCRVEGRTDYPGRMPFSSRNVIDTLFDLLDENQRRIDRWATPITMIVCAGDRIVDTPAAERYFERLTVDEKNWSCYRTAVTKCRSTESGSGSSS
ncbi:MAG: alpha/beta fold hydrolase [Planctomycetota bacterium]